MYLRDAYGKAACKLCLNLIQDNLYSNCIKQKEKHRKPVSSIIKTDGSFLLPNGRRIPENQNPEQADASCTTSFCLCKPFKDLNHCADKD